MEKLGSHQTDFREIFVLRIFTELFVALPLYGKIGQK
jgi:hypothetical protein